MPQAALLPNPTTVARQLCGGTKISPNLHNMSHCVIYKLYNCYDCVRSLEDAIGRRSVTHTVVGTKLCWSKPLLPLKSGIFWMSSKQKCRVLTGNEW